MHSNVTPRFKPLTNINASKTFLNHKVSNVLHVLHVLHEWRSSEGLDPTWEARQSNISPHAWRSQQWQM